MPALITPPTGTVTFLFTDIEGSTRLWEQNPDAMRPALARHDALLRQAIDDNGGFVFKTVGDAFCAAFPTANQALEAALAAQLALSAEPWETPMPLRVRMALHTGAAEERDGDYFGPTLNRVARLMAAGYGGQVLLSEASQALVRDALPPDALLLSLGEHRLKDLGRPEQTYQLLHPNMPSDFPPLRSLNNPALPNNLPQQVTSFIGREKQAEEIKALLGKTRLLTLTGAGGNGKTRLSLQVAADLLDGEGDGVWLVELAALSDPALVPQAVADVLGIKEEAGRTIQQTLVAAMKTKHLLLVLDNCEHMIAACASLAADLLRNCPEVHILATSREPLNVSGEQTYRVPSLSSPNPKAAQTAASLSQFEAVRLFIERAQAVQASFNVTNANAPAVAQICFRLDGIPLALELAAARVRSLSVDEISTRLDQRFRLLTGGLRTALPRQQTLRALIDWSYDLLNEQEKIVLRRLSVFAGGWTLAAAERVCSDTDREEWEVLDLLTSLVDKSLVMYEEAEGRYGLLETVRQYAGDRLTESGEQESARSRAASWFLALAEEAEPLLTGPEQQTWLGRLEAEHDNLRTILTWDEQSPNGTESGLRLAGALWRFWFVRGYYSEGRQWLSRALQRTQAGTGKEKAASAARAKALNGAGNLADEQGDYAGARDLYAESLTLRQRLGDRPSIAGLLSNLGSVAAKQGDDTRARALFEESLAVFRQLANLQGIAGLLSNLGIVAAHQGDYAGSRAMYQESLNVFRQIGNPQGIAASLNNLANALMEQGDYEAARTLHEESLTLQRQLGNQRGIANSLNNLGSVAVAQGKFAKAGVLVEESLELNRQMGNQRGIADTLGNLGKVAFGQGNYTAAQTLFEESLAVFRELGDQAGIADTLGLQGDVAFARKDYAATLALHEESLAIQRHLGHLYGVACGLQSLAGVAREYRQPQRAARLWGAVNALCLTLGSHFSAAEQDENDKEAASVREMLGEDAFNAAWNEGQAMTWVQAVEYALTAE